MREIELELLSLEPKAWTLLQGHSKKRAVPATSKTHELAKKSPIRSDDLCVRQTYVKTEESTLKSQF